MKNILLSIILIPTLSSAQMAVLDVGANAALQVLNSQTAQGNADQLAKFVESIAKYETMIQTGNDQLNTQNLMKTAMGTAADVTGIEGLASSSLLSQQGLVKVGTELVSGVTGQINNDNSSIYKPIPTTTEDGVSIERDPENYKPYEALETAKKQYDDVFEQTETQEAQVKREIEAAKAQINSAANDAEVQKGTAALNAKLAELNTIQQQKRDASDALLAQYIANENNRQKQETARQDAEIAADNASSKEASANALKWLNKKSTRYKAP